MATIEKIIHLLKCINCDGEALKLNDERILCEKCGAIFPIKNNIVRFVPESFISFDTQQRSLEEKTKNYFGFEWELFGNWGFIDEEKIKKENLFEYYGGTVSARKSTFNSKCRLSRDELKEGNIIIDAGCGNGRYTYEAALRGKGTVIGVDIGYGSVESAGKNTKELDNVIIIQASLFKLPFRNGKVDAAFSNGVLMHTGNARNAFNEIARTISGDGVFVAHLYHKLNPVWELNDFILRSITTRLSVESNMKLAVAMAKIGKIFYKNRYMFQLVNLLFRLQPTVIHMFDWYSAPIATHHTYREVARWFAVNGFEVVDPIPRYGLVKRPWALNLKGRKVRD